MKKQYKHNDHSYALDLQDVVRHISQVERGRKGYFCPGCRQRMIARKGDIKLPHFAHDPQDIVFRGKCTYSDETIRHKLGKEILQRIKWIKVPSLRKFPVKGQEGAIQIIRESWTVEAHSVAVEMPFYENDDGQILWGKSLEWKADSQKHLLIQPDVTFFDVAGKPILLIELVATHKINNDKYRKIRNLGLDTIQVSLPTGPLIEIEEAFNKTAFTKWIYNYERENTEYQYVPPRTGQNVLFGDEFEKGLINFERTYECKTFEVNAALRRFRRYLESEQFTRIRESINTKIRRTERNSTSARKQWRELQETIDGEVSAEFGSERARLDEIEAQLSLAEEELRREEAEVAEKYHSETGRIGLEKRDYQSPRRKQISDLKYRITELAGSGKTLSERIDDLKAEEANYERTIEPKIADIERQTVDTGRKISEIDSIIQRLEEEMAGFPGESVAVETKIRGEIESGEFSLRSESEKSAKELRANFERDRDLFTGAVKDRDTKRTPKLNRKIKELVEAGRLLDSIPTAAKLYERLRFARKELDSGSYKSWIRS